MNAKQNKMTNRFDVFLKTNTEIYNASPTTDQLISWCALIVQSKLRCGTRGKRKVTENKSLVQCAQSQLLFGKFTSTATIPISYDVHGFKIAK